MRRLFVQPMSRVEIPSLTGLLFSDSRAAWPWLFVRVYLGWQWIQSGWPKVKDPAWMDGGEAVQGFWAGATVIPEQGRPPITYDWYRDFINALLHNDSYTWFAPLVAWGELLVGIGLILGALVGVTAFFGAFMNWNYIMAGSAGPNALFFPLAILLMLAWRVAGHIGLDRYLLPRLKRGRKPDKQHLPDPTTTSPGA